MWALRVQDTLCGFHYREGNNNACLVSNEKLFFHLPDNCSGGFIILNDSYSKELLMGAIQGSLAVECKY